MKSVENRVSAGTSASMMQEDQYPHQNDIVLNTSPFNVLMQAAVKIFA